MPSLWDDKFFNFPVVQDVSKVFAGVQFFTPKDYPKRGDPGLGRSIHIELYTTHTFKAADHMVKHGTP